VFSGLIKSFFFLFSPLATRHFFLYAFLVFPKPRQIETESALYEAAIKILMRRAHSVHEMKKALIRRTADEDLIQKVIARLKQNGYIDDARYAKQFARQRTEGRKQGKFRVARDLRARGVPDRHIEAALEEAAQNTDEASVVRQRIERKLRSYRGPGSERSGHLQVGRLGANLDEKKLASLYRSLLRAGFSADVIRRELKSLTRADVPED
jgi:regulatory protein